MTTPKKPGLPEPAAEDYATRRTVRLARLAELSKLGESHTVSIVNRPPISLENALTALEARKAEIETYKTEHATELAAEKAKRDGLNARLAALPQVERRQVLDAAGMKHVSAAPPPLTRTTGSGDVSPAPEPLTVPVVPASASDGVELLPAHEPKRKPATGPVFSMRKGAMITQHKQRWPTIESDMSDASTNGLHAAKAGARGWTETAALDWARANNKLLGAAKPADELAQAMHSMGSLPRKEHILKG